LEKEIVKINSIGANGVGVTKTKDGKICFVPFTLEDEICEIDIVENHSDYAVGKLIRVIEKSEKRIEPQCAIFEKCGGCNFLHTTYENELNIKKKVVLETLSKIGKINYEEIINVDEKGKNNQNNNDNFLIPSKSRFHYRNNVQIKTTKDGEIGFYAPKTLKVVPFPNFKCLLLTERMQNFIDNIDKKFFLFTKGFTLRDGLKIYSAHLNYLTDSNFCEYKVNDFIYRVGISDFFQVNSFLLDRFQLEACNLVKEDFSTIELYGGVGFFSLPMAKKLDNLLVNELSKNAISNGKFNSKQNNINNIEFIASDASFFIKKYNDVLQIFVDPPRAGMEKEVVKIIKDSKIQRIIYVSCNPATFSRDLLDLSEKGFKLKKLKIIDNFPATYHIELISLIER